MTRDPEHSDCVVFSTFSSWVCWLFRPVCSTKMNKSSLVVLSLGLLAVLSCLNLVVHGKPAQSWWCCKQPIPGCCRNCCHGAVSAWVKRRAQAMAVKSTLLSDLQDTRAEVAHPGVRVIGESYYRAWLTKLKLSTSIRYLVCAERSWQRRDLVLDIEIASLRTSDKRLIMAWFISTVNTLVSATQSFCLW